MLRLTFLAAFLLEFGAAGKDKKRTIERLLFKRLLWLCSMGFWDELYELSIECQLRDTESSSACFC